MAFQEPKQLHNHSISSIAQGHVKAHVVPHRQDLEGAAAILNAGEKVAVLGGHGFPGAIDDVIAVTDQLGGWRSACEVRPGRRVKRGHPVGGQCTGFADASEDHRPRSSVGHFLTGSLASFACLLDSRKR